MDQRIIDLYDEYTHAPLDRRVFLERLAALAGGTAAALALVPLLEANRAKAAMITADDPRLSGSGAAFAGASGEVKGYLARPAGLEKLPAIVVVHENRGLNPHIEDVARRAALEGFLVVAPDFLSPLGGTPEDQDQARERIGKLDMGTTVQDAVAAVTYLRGHPESTGKVGAVGFCWGGGLVGQLAVNDPTLDAAVVFYGRTPAPEEVARIRAPLLLHYAGLDPRINEGVPGFQQALDEAGAVYRLHMYEGVNHAFHNDTSAERYDKAAAELAWSRTIAFLREHLGSAA